MGTYASPTHQGKMLRSYRGLIHPSPIINPENSNYSNSVNSFHGNITLPDRSLPRIINSFGNSDFIESNSYNSGIGIMTSSLPVSSPMRQSMGNSKITQLPVRHTTLSGTQEGVLFPKYFSNRSSKCIMCKACGIFFTHEMFLSHLHDVYGKRVECQGQRLEMAVDAPNIEQIKTFEEILSKLNNESRIQSNQRPASPALNMKSKTVQQSPLANKWTQDIQETVRASEKLLKETSEYLRTSASKLKHRRRNSLQLQELPFSAKGNAEVVLSSLAHKQNDAVPIIKTQNRHRSSRKSLYNHFKSNQTDKKDANLQLPLPPATAELVNSLKLSNDNTETSSEKENGIDLTTFMGCTLLNKSSDSRSHASGTALHGDFQLQTALCGDSKLQTALHGDHQLQAVLHGNPQLQTALRRDSKLQMSALHGDSQLQTSFHGDSQLQTVLHGDPKHSNTFEVSEQSSGAGSKTGSGDAQSSGREKKDSQRLPNGLVRSTQDKNDPVYILQTAQDLITLATQKVMQKQQNSQDNEWYSKYQEEHTLRLKCEANIAELKDLLKEEQRQRQELEIQLRALRLQHL